ncbi:hypothetical protein Hypma_008360 [Hypsizygus marmoreus]|uniref:CCHC-type domain-containing protein n=1 Tax=Hypsizygus marmoreus TaxID=39966 RepID=A0A369JY17_HYPMA|nr:hypothetical protein Hypma_008360 [Hypsizygus marmoreus]
MQADSKSHLPTKLNADNYYAWSYRMELKLRKLGVWSLVNGEESRPVGSDNHKVVKAWRTRVDLALSEIVGEVGDAQLVHTRSSRDPHLVWERLKSVHMSQGLGSVISTWQKFFQLKKASNVSVQAHAAALRELADRLTFLDDGPSESLMVAVLMLSLPESYNSLIVSLDSHTERTDFDFVVAHCINEEARQLGAGKRSGSDVAYSADARPKRDRKDVTCYRCQKKGHYRNECQEKLAEDGKKDSAAGAVVDDSNSEDEAW